MFPLYMNIYFVLFFHTSNWIPRKALGDSFVLFPLCSLVLSHIHTLSISHTYSHSQIHTIWSLSLTLFPILMSTSHYLSLRLSCTRSASGCFTSFHILSFVILWNLRINESVYAVMFFSPFSVYKLSNCIGIMLWFCTVYLFHLFISFFFPFKYHILFWESQYRFRFDHVTFCVQIDIISSR